MTTESFAIQLQDAETQFLHRIQDAYIIRDMDQAEGNLFADVTFRATIEAEQAAYKQARRAIEHRRIDALFNRTQPTVAVAA